MTMDNVRRLMERLPKDDALRKALNTANGQEERERVLTEHGLHFSQDEFDQIVDHLHTKCETREQAEAFFEFRNWWDFLRRT